MPKKLMILVLGWFAVSVTIGSLFAHIEGERQFNLLFGLATGGGLMIWIAPKLLVPEFALMIFDYTGTRCSVCGLAVDVREAKCLKNEGGCGAVFAGVVTPDTQLSDVVNLLRPDVIATILIPHPEPASSEPTF